MRLRPFLLALAVLLCLAVAPFAAAHHQGGECVSFLEGGDIGYRVCVDAADGACPVYMERDTFIGTHTTCLVPPECAPEQTLACLGF